MDRDTVIALAKKTDLWQMLETYSGEFGDGFVEADCLPDLMAFVTAIEDHITWSSIHTCHPGCTKPPCVAMRQAVLAEQQFTNNAYRERNQLVALLSTLFPSGKAKTAIEGWDEAWHGCVYIDFPWGQASWHYHTDDEWMFEHLPPYTKPWDGHTTEAKYAAIAAAIRSRT